MPVELVKVAPLESDGSGAKWTVRAGRDTCAGGGVGVGTLRGGSEGVLGAATLRHGSMLGWSRSSTPGMGRSGSGVGARGEGVVEVELGCCWVTLMEGVSRGFGDGDTMALRRSVRRIKASWWLVGSGAKGDAGDGWCRAWTMAATPARMRSVDEATGSECLVGSHVSVSQIREARDAQIQTT